jgi:hypothetical protein
VTGNQDFTASIYSIFFVITQFVCSLNHMAALNTKFGFEIGGYVLVRWVIFIAPDFVKNAPIHSHLQV